MLNIVIMENHYHSAINPGIRRHIQDIWHQSKPLLIMLNYLLTLLIQKWDLWLHLVVHMVVCWLHGFEWNILIWYLVPLPRAHQYCNLNLIVIDSIWFCRQFSLLAIKTVQKTFVNPGMYLSKYHLFLNNNYQLI